MDQKSPSTGENSAFQEPAFQSSWSRRNLLSLSLVVLVTILSVASLSVRLGKISSTDNSIPPSTSSITPASHSVSPTTVSFPPSTTSKAFTTTSTAITTNPTSRWAGWDQIETIFIFGDSYSSTEFDSSKSQPNPSNPLGNPPYPGFTSSNGPNWVDFLTTKWNKSYVETFDLACGGATVDSDLVVPFLPTVRSLKQQIEDDYCPNYGSSPQWNPNVTLFAIWIGINDIGNSFARKNDSLNAAIFDVYSNLVDKLYISGARNILFFNVPPLEQTPRTIAEGHDAQMAEKADILDFNWRIDGLVQNLTDAYLDVSAMQFNAHALFSQVLLDPTVFPETAGYRNLTNWCEKYSGGTPEWDTSDPECSIAVNEYLWLNDLHPTYPIHNATARHVARKLTLHRD